jgi:hypothetical protein
VGVAWRHFGQNSREARKDAKSACSSGGRLAIGGRIPAAGPRRGTAPGGQAGGSGPFGRGGRMRRILTVVGMSVKAAAVEAEPGLQ